MKSFLLRNGDLVLGAGGYETTDGSARIRQDLGLAVRDPYGADRFHPRWGSVLDTFVGTIIDPNTPVLIEGEVRRVVQNFVALQQHQMQKDAGEGRPSRYSTTEVITAVQGVSMFQSQDRVAVKVVLETMARDQITLDEGVDA